MALSLLYQIQAWLEQEFSRGILCHMDYTQKFASHTAVSRVQQKDTNLCKKTDILTTGTVTHHTNKTQICHSQILSLSQL